MFTLFTTGKPFAGHSGIIQRNALKSWTLLHPDVEVIVFGDEEGAAEACGDLGLRHEAHVERNEAGLKRIDYYFDRAQELARHRVLCYVNCDIILTRDFLRAVAQVRDAHRKFLMVGRRWDTDIREAIDYAKPAWEEEVRRSAAAANHQCDEKWIDYFAFPRGLYHKKIPAFVVGRVAWDNWLVWRAAKLGAAVVDASKAVGAVHQNHDYSYHPQGKDGVWNDEQARRNFELAGGWKHLWSIADAGWVVQRDGGVRRNPDRHRQTWLRLRKNAARVWTYDVWLPSWHFVLDVTRPVRKALGLRTKQAADAGVLRRVDETTDYSAGGYVQPREVHRASAGERAGAGVVAGGAGNCGGG